MNVEATSSDFSFGSLVTLLRCPECGEALAFTDIPQPESSEDDPGGRYGVLACSCSRYPVVDDIPIFRRQAVAVQAHVSGKVHLEGAQPQTLLQLIERGKGVEALLELIAFPYFPPGLEPSYRLRRLACREPLLGLGFAWRRAALRRMLCRRDSLTVEDWLELFYRRSAIPGNFEYFFYRFGQPRHLTALSLMATFPERDRPILDLACGFGHLTHSLTCDSRRHRVIGVDRNFYHLWVARHWLAPDAHFVCAEADTPLPFADASLSGALCADAFHLFADKATCVAELRRATGDGTLMLTRVGNRLRTPNEGAELTPAEYAALLTDLPHRVVGEPELLERYLRGEGAALAVWREPEALEGEKWVSLVASRDASVLVDHGAFGTWPHAAGTLALNPIYRGSRQGQEEKLTFAFPSAHYAAENSDMRSYLPESVVLDAATRRALAEGRRTRRVDELIERFVVLGLPDAYLRAQRPRARRGRGRAAALERGGPNRS